MPIDNLLKNEAYSKQLSTQGYVLLDVGLDQQITNLQQYILDNFQLPAESFYYSLLSNDYEKNLQIKEKVRQELSDFYDTFFQNFRTITESFLAKPANTPQEFLLHQDWCYTDETKFNAYNIWIPLVDVDEQNGAMFFLPGSHLWFNNYRSGTLPTGRVSISEINEPVQTVRMKRGQVLIFHPAVFHGSYPNTTSHNRVVVTATLMENNAPFLVYADNGRNELNIYAVHDDTLLKDLKTLAVGALPAVNTVAAIPYKHHIIIADDLRRKSLQIF